MKRLVGGLVAALGVASSAVALAQPRAAAPAGSEAAKAGPNEHAVLEIRPSAHPFKELDIENPLGDVRVEGYDGDAISVETWKYGPDEDALDRLHVSLVPNPDGTVRITTGAEGGREVKPMSRASVHLDVVIRAPRNTHIDAAVSAGKLVINNMDAGGELDTSSGPISVNNISGELWTHSVSGKTSIAEAFGSVDAATVSSDLDLDSIGGEKLVASASKGRIAGRRVRSRDVELTTTDGRIQLEAELALRGHLVISSLRGDVDVRLHATRGAATVRARGVKVDLGGGSIARQTAPDGWATAMIGQVVSRGDLPALVELQSRFANVQFAIVP